MDSIIKICTLRQVTTTVWEFAKFIRVEKIREIINIRMLKPDFL